MVAIFIALAVVGFLFLLVSAIFGGDHDVGGHDISHDVDASHDVVQGGPSPFSLRVISIFITAFGAAGAIAALLHAPAWAIILIATVSGLLMGAIALVLLRFCYGQQSTSSVDADEMVGQMGQVKTAIPTSGVGQVSVVVKSQRFYPIARSKGGEEIEEGAAVKIVQYLGDMVIVERASEAKGAQQ